MKTTIAKVTNYKIVLMSWKLSELSYENNLVKVSTLEHRQLSKNKVETPETSFSKKLNELPSIDEVICFSKEKFSDRHQYLFERVRYLIEVFDYDEGDEVSIDSLKSMMLFLFAESKFKKPTLTLNEDGTFQSQWEIDRHNWMTLCFKKDENLDYVIFRSSQYTTKPIVLHGRMNIWDFRDHLNRLSLKFHLEGKRRL